MEKTRPKDIKTLEGITNSEQKLLPIRDFKESDETLRQMALIEFYGGFNTPLKKGSLRTRIRKAERWLDKKDVQILFEPDSLNFLIYSKEYKKNLLVKVELRMGGTQLGYEYVWGEVEVPS